MTACPLPIDWLDLLDDRPSAATRPHLAECASCRALVDQLAATTSERADAQVVLRLIAQRQRRDTLTANMTPHEVKAGQIWWLTTETLDQRLPVLIVAVVQEDDSEPLIDVAPLWTDEDNATPADLLLNESDSTIGVRWRVAFRRQTLVARASLDTLVGRLTASGQALLNEALAGHISAERSGPELESDRDPRLAADAWMDRVLATAAVGMDGEDDTDEFPNTASEAEPSVDLAMTVPTRGKVLLFELKTRRDTAVRSDKLAAASPSVGESVTEAMLRDDAAGISVIAVLWADYRTDELLLHPRVVHGVDQPVRLVVHSARLAAPVSVEARLEVGQPVTLTTDEPISELDVQALEMHLS
jgi:predicted anti-sigma-YlaC factor YlaD